MALKCVNCGAPLEFREGVEVVQCLSCGFYQKLVDSQLYAERLRGEIYKWISEMVPPSLLAAPGTVDAVARHNLFIYNVKPRVASEYALYKSKVSMLMSNYLVHFPFWIPPQVRFEDNPKDAFEKLAKVEGLAPLIVVDEDQKYYAEVTLTSTLYAYLVNALTLIREKADVSFIINNFKTIGEYIEKNVRHDERKAEYARVVSILKSYESIKCLIEKDPRTARSKCEESLVLMRKARDEARVPQVAYMIPSIEKDMRNIETVQNLSDASLLYSEAGRDPGEFLMTIEKFFRLAEHLREYSKMDVSMYGEVSRYLRDIVASKTGVGQINVVPGDGSLLIPMWAVKTTYTFTTGALFMKKGKAIDDFILISAVPASQPVTDIFLLDSGVGFLDRIRGKEDTMSKGILGNVLESVKSTSIPGSIKVLPPLVTQAQASRTYDSYMQTVYDRTGGKIKLGVCESSRLIFARAVCRGNDIDVPVLRDSQIRVSPYLDRLLEIAI